MNRQWLMQNADAPVRYNLDKSDFTAEVLLQNDEVSAWFSRLAERSQDDNIGKIHGSHDYRMENILGKCWILGLSKDIPAFAEKMAFILRYLNQHIQTSRPDELSFGKIYHLHLLTKEVRYFDGAIALGCFRFGDDILPANSLIGFADSDSALGEVEIRRGEGEQFAQPDTAPVQHFKCVE